MELLFLLGGAILGSVVTSVIFRIDSGYGYFKLEKVPDEEDFYTINMRILPNQKLDKKKKITLTRE